MSKTKLSPLRRAFWLGYRAGFNKALAKMACRAHAWEDEIAALQSDYQILIDEMRCARDERAVQEAVSERAMHPDGWLN